MCGACVCVWGGGWGVGEHKKVNLLLKNQQREVGEKVSSPFRWSLTVLLPTGCIEKNPLCYSAQ